MNTFYKYNSSSINYPINSPINSPNKLKNKKLIMPKLKNINHIKNIDFSKKVNDLIEINKNMLNKQQYVQKLDNINKVQINNIKEDSQKDLLGDPKEDPQEYPQEYPKGDTQEYPQEYQKEDLLGYPKEDLKKEFNNYENFNIFNKTIILTNKNKQNYNKVFNYKSLNNEILYLKKRINVLEKEVQKWKSLYHGLKIINQNLGGNLGDPCG
jgi:hypothetical protein